MQETEKDDKSGSEYLSNVASCKSRSASSLYLHIVNTPPCEKADIPNTHTVCAFGDHNKQSHSKSHERTGSIRCQCVVSNFEYDCHIPCHIYRTPGKLGVWAGCPRPEQFITPQHRTNRVPQGSPSYAGGQRFEVPLCLRSSPPGWAMDTQAYCS